MLRTEVLKETKISDTMVLLRLFDYQGALTVRYHRQRSFYRRRLFAAYDTYIGVITPEGVLRSDKKKVTLTDASVKEFGFSKAVESLCPQSWKEPLGKDWREVLDFIILKESAESYIATERGTIDELNPHIQYGAQKSSLIRRMQKESGADMKDLKCLLTIYLIYMDGNKIVSKISDEQREILERFHINLEVD